MTGRPLKHTVEWFSHDANASDGKTLTILENHFGPDGYATWFKLLERLSTTNNHVIDCRKREEMEFLAAKMKQPTDRLQLILDKMAEIGAIDIALWSHKIVWCQNLVDRMKPVYDNRKQELPHKPVISTTDNAVSNPILQPIMPFLTTETTHRKKGSKESNPLPPCKSSSQGTEIKR